MGARSSSRRQRSRVRHHARQHESRAGGSTQRGGPAEDRQRGRFQGPRENHTQDLSGKLRRAACGSTFSLFLAGPGVGARSSFSFLSLAAHFFSFCFSGRQQNKKKESSKNSHTNRLRVDDTCRTRCSTDRDPGRTSSTTRHRIRIAHSCRRACTAGGR